MTTASSLFQGGLNCAQAVLASAAPRIGLEPEVARRIASAFGAGLGRKQEVCGAVSGALMALGLRHGFEDGTDRPGRERIYGMAQRLQDGFRAAHGSVVCRELLGVDLLTPEGQKVFSEKNLLESVCQRCVTTAETLAWEMLEENP